ncbi:MAG: hypothetical protein WC492_03815 [Candidatus Micrarchaeia archaeon]|jgi:hypothetical protein
MCPLAMTIVHSAVHPKQPWKNSLSVKKALLEYHSGKWTLKSDALYAKLIGKLRDMVQKTASSYNCVLSEESQNSLVIDAFIYAGGFYHKHPKINKEDFAIKIYAHIAHKIFEV